MVQASDQDATRAPPFGGFPGTSDWEETPRQTQNPLEGLYISLLAWERLGIPQEELESVAGEKEAWRALLEPAATATRPRISGGQWMDGWMYREEKEKKNVYRSLNSDESNSDVTTADSSYMHTITEAPKI